MQLSIIDDNTNLQIYHSLHFGSYSLSVALGRAVMHTTSVRPSFAIELLRSSALIPNMLLARAEDNQTYDFPNNQLFMRRVSRAADDL